MVALELETSIGLLRPLKKEVGYEITLVSDYHVICGTLSGLSPALPVLSARASSGKVVDIIVSYHLQLV